MNVTRERTQSLKQSCKETAGDITGLQPVPRTRDPPQTHFLAPQSQPASLVSPACGRARKRGSGQGVGQRGRPADGINHQGDVSMGRRRGGPGDHHSAGPGHPLPWWPMCRCPHRGSPMHSTQPIGQCCMWGKRNFFLTPAGNQFTP